MIPFYVIVNSQDGDKNLFPVEEFHNSLSKNSELVITNQRIWFFNCKTYFLDNCAIFSATIFLNRRENTPIGENGF